MPTAAAPPAVSPFDGRAFIIDLIERDTAAALERCADDVEWVVPGDPRFGGGTHRGKQGVLAFLGRVVEFFPRGLRLVSVTEWPSDGGAVIEATLAGVAAGEVPSCTRYVFVIEATNGRVTAIREYTDTAYAEALLGRERAR